MTKTRRSTRQAAAAVTTALALALGAATAAQGAAASAPAATERFQLQSRFWPSLHQTLMEASQRGGVENPGVGDGERAAWEAAVAAYRQRIGDRNPVRDEPLISLDEALARLADDAAPAGLPYAAHDALVAAAPVYRQRLWPVHARGNEFWIAVARGLLAGAGDELVAAHERVYGEPYPARVVVDVTPYGGRFSGYTNDLTFAHTVISSRDPDYQAFGALELLLHEASHTVVRPFGGVVGKEIGEAESALGRKAHPQLWHAIQFYTTGELTARVLAARGVDRFVPFVDKGLWDAAFRGLRDAIVRHWRPYLDGQGTREAAIRAIVEETTKSP